MDKLEERRVKAKEKNQAKRQAGKKLGGSGRKDAVKPNFSGPNPDALYGGLNNPYPKV